jgi:hypothetical protein
MTLKNNVADNLYPMPSMHQLRRKDNIIFKIRWKKKTAGTGFPEQSE